MFSCVCLLLKTPVAVALLFVPSLAVFNRRVRCAFEHKVDLVPSASNACMPECTPE